MRSVNSGKTNPVIILFILSAVFLPSCAKKEISETKFLMDTVMEIKASGRISNFDLVWQDIQALDDKLSPYKENSEISAVNKSAGLRAVKVSAETAGFLSSTLEFSKKASGVFDPTVYPLVQLWNVTSGNPKVPPQNAVRTALSLVDYRKVTIVSGSVYLERKGMGLDLGGDAKGYVCDIAVKDLQKAGATEGLINAGGNIEVFGDRTWQIGIRHPRNANDTFAVINLKNCAAATSGDYERYFIKDGVRYHHILDLKTGYPARRAVSATVIAPTGLLSDLLSTTVFILGPKDGLELLKKFPGTEGIIVDLDGNVFVSEGLKNAGLPQTISLFSKK